MKKRVLTISIVMVMLLSLLIAGCDSFGLKPEELTPEPEPTPTATLEPTPEPVADVLEEIDEEEEEEEVVEAETDEPPFLTTLRTGVYGYDMYLYATKNDWVIEGDSYVYSNGSLMAICSTDDSGKVMIRYIYDYDKNTIYTILVDDKQYMIQDNADFWYTFGIPDFCTGFDQSGKGTTEFEGETLDYIDCGSGEEEPVRVFIKDGDVYAIVHNANDWAHTFYLLKTYSSPPTTEYFEIPDDYELIPSR